MVRYSYYLVTIFLGLFLTSCIIQVDLPRDIYMEDDFSVDHEEVILDAIDEWNQVGLRCIGKEIINYVGVIDDPDGFDENDLGDNRHIIYLESQDSEIYQEILEHFYSSGFGEKFYPVGYGTPNDIIIFPDSKDDLEKVRQIVLHELGHFLGIQHNHISPDFFEEGETSVMFHPTLEEYHLTEIDIEAFCLVHDCPYCSF